MMHGTKKSHSLIVPAKPANKAEQSAAESVEGDDGTKRKVGLQSTVRTQGREAVSQAQDRIREAENRKKKEKLTPPLHHVSVDVLRWAFFNVPRRSRLVCIRKRPASLSSADTLPSAERGRGLGKPESFDFLGLTHY